MADDDWDAPEPAIAKPTTSWDDSGGGDVAEAWDAEPEPEKPKGPAAAGAPKVGGGKKLTGAKLREKEEAEKRARAAAQARQRASDAEEAKKRQDPNYLQSKKEQEKRDMELAEQNLASDLFGDAPAPKPRPAPEGSAAAGAAPSVSSKAAELASASGLGDGADSTGGGALQGVKGEATAPSLLDPVDFTSKEALAGLASNVARKLLALKKSDMVLYFLKELSGKVGADLKVDDAQELLRVITVIKNEASKAQQNKKKKDKGKSTLKAIGGDFDDGYGGRGGGGDFDFIE